MSHIDITERLTRRQMKVFENHFRTYKLDFASNIEDGAKYYKNATTALVFEAFQVGGDRVRGLIVDTI